MSGKRVEEDNISNVVVAVVLVVAIVCSIIGTMAVMTGLSSVGTTASFLNANPIGIISLDVENPHKISNENNAKAKDISNGKISLIIQKPVQKR